MFLRKLVVVIVPLLLAAALSVLMPLLRGMPFWTEALQGLLLGTVLALLLPLAGATRKREPFAGLLWVPLLVLVIAVLAQYLWVIGVSIPVLDMLHTTDSDVVLMECALIGFLTVQTVRTKL